MLNSTEILSAFSNEKEHLNSISQMVLVDYDFVKNKLKDLKGKSIPIFGNPLGDLMNSFIKVYYQVNLHLLNYDQYNQVIHSSTDGELGSQDLLLQLKSMSNITQEILTEYDESKTKLSFCLDTKYSMQA